MNRSSPGDRAPGSTPAQMRRFFDRIPVGLYVSTPEGRILDANPAFLKIFGAGDLEALIDVQSDDLYVDPSDRLAWQKRIAEEGVVHDFVSRLRRLSGETIWLEETSRAVEDEEGNIVQYEGVVQDITEKIRAEEKLATTEALLLAAIEQTPAGVIIADAPDTNIRIANRAALGIRGKTGHDLTSIPAQFHPSRWDIRRPDGTPCTPDELPLTRAVVEGETTHDAEMIIRRESGEDRWVLVNAAPVRNSRGEIVAGVVVFPDITDRKKVQESLKRREAILEAVGFAAAQFLRAPSWEQDIDEVLARLGEAADVCRVYIFENFTDSEGIPCASQKYEWVAPDVSSFLDDEEMIHLPWEEAGLGRWFEVLSRGDTVAGHVGAFQDSEQRVLLEQDIQSILLVPVFVREQCWGLIGFDACRFRRDWSTFEVEALRAAASTLAAAIHRKRTEAERYRLARAVEQTAESIVITDTAGLIEYVNPAFERVTGYTAEEAIGSNPSVLKSGMHDTRFYRDLWETIRRGDIWAGHFINRRKDGGLYEEEAFISPIRDVAGEIVNYLAVKRDVTQQVALERQLRQAQKMESMGLLAGGIAHDFNNVLGQILNSAELLDEKLEGSAHRGYLDLILEAVNRGQNITGRMLAFSRREESSEQVVSAEDLLKDIREVAQHTFPKGIRLETGEAGDPEYAQCDAGQIQQVLMNLCVNAVDAMPEGGTLRLAYHRATANEVAHHAPDSAARYVCLTVSDTGMGMTKAELDRIFLPFYTSKPQGKGTGLGLYIVYGIVKAHDGWVWVESEKGRGTKFVIGLPSADKPDQHESVDERTSIRGQRGTGQHILVVDDEPGLLTLMREILANEGYRVSLASDGKQALEFMDAEDAPVDLVITDIGMPVMGGRELVENLREYHPTVPVMAASGYVASNELSRLRGLGVGIVLSKPYRINEVLRKVALALA